MAWKAIYMFVIILAFFHLIISSSTPVSSMPSFDPSLYFLPSLCYISVRILNEILSLGAGTRHPFHERQQSGAVQTTKQMASLKATEDDSTQGVEFQLNDYAPAGANPFHTPRPPHV
ncbi:hypothetical protein Droror1_Dr00018783 [Drosera rotundifolia]